MFKLTYHPKITEGISFESYPSIKKFLSCLEDPKGEDEVEVNGGLQHSRWKFFRISKFIVGDPGEPYFKIPIKTIKQVSGNNY